MTRAAGPYPKIELHVHLEATIQPETLLAIAKRNGEALPATTVEALRELYRFRDFDHFIEVWILTTNCLRHEADFRQVVVDYAAEAKRHGAVYLEAIFSPIERTWRGVVLGRDLHGLLRRRPGGARAARRRGPPDPRHHPQRLARGRVDARRATRPATATAGSSPSASGARRRAIPPEPFAPAFEAAREHGLGSVPHAGEVVGPVSIRGALDTLEPDRIRHGIRAVEDPALVRELAESGIVLDVTPISNVRTGAVASLEDHPLPRLVGAGVRCSVSTDDPVMFDTDLTREYEAVEALGLDPRALYETAVAGALCDDETRSRLEARGAAFAWNSTAAEGR